MEQWTKPRKVRRRPLANALVLGVFLAVGGGRAAEGAPADCGDLDGPAGAALAQTGGQLPAAPPAAEGGMRIYIDPQTGQFTEPPPGTLPPAGPPAADAATDTSDAGLVERPSPTPGGGTMMDLQGRFQSPLVGTHGPDGRLLIEHLHSTPGLGTMR